MSKLPISVGLKSGDKPDVPTLVEPLAPKVLAPIGHAATTTRLMQKQSARQFHNYMLTTGLSVRLTDPTVWSEWIQLQAAVAQRLQKQNQDLRKGFAILVDDYSQLKQANTMSKLMEKQCNLVSQWGALMGSQATNLMELLENVQVDYGYWASQKLAS